MFQPCDCLRQVSPLFLIVALIRDEAATVGQQTDHQRSGGNTKYPSFTLFLVHECPPCRIMRLPSCPTVPAVLINACWTCENAARRIVPTGDRIAAVSTIWHLGHPDISAQAALSGEKRTCRRRAKIDANDLGYVKTLQAVVNAQHKNRTRRHGDSLHAQSLLSLNQSCAKAARERVFTQPRPRADIGLLLCCSSDADFWHYQNAFLSGYDATC